MPMLLQLALGVTRGSTIYRIIHTPFLFLKASAEQGFIRC